MEMIYVYSRAQAIEDGVLIDVSKMGREAGFKYPVAITQTVWWEYIEPSEEAVNQGQDRDGRLWDTLFMLHVAAHKTRNHDPEIRFPVIFDNKVITLKALCHGGDSGEPVITIMMPNED